MITLNEKNCTFFTLNKTKNSKPMAEAVSYPHLHICFIADGDALWQINNTNYQVKPGNIIFLSDNQYRRFLSYGENGFCLRVICLDRRAFTDSQHLSFFLTCIRKLNGVFESCNLIPLLEEVYAELSEKKENYRELASLKLTEFFIKAERFMNYSPSQAGKYDKKMEQVMDFIDSNLTSGISLCSAAKFAGFTESSFSRWFAKTNGVSFKKYIMAKKIDLAITLLKTTDLKVLDIAYESGFDSISGFYDTFKKITGTTPNKFTYRHNI